MLQSWQSWYLEYRVGQAALTTFLVTFDKVLNFYNFCAVQTYAMLQSQTQIFVELRSRTILLSAYSIDSFFVDMNSADQHCQVSV